MNVYVYEYVDELTSAYHSGGGLVVIADEQPTVWHLNHTYAGPAKDVALPEPTAVYELVGDVEPKTFLFPDAGCC